MLNKSIILSSLIIILGSVYVINVMLLLYSYLSNGAYAGIGWGLIMLYSFFPSTVMCVLVLSYIIVYDIDINKNIVIYVSAAMLSNVFCQVMLMG